MADSLRGKVNRLSMTEKQMPNMVKEIRTMKSSLALSLEAMLVPEQRKLITTMN